MDFLLKSIKFINLFKNRVNRFFRRYSNYKIIYCRTNNKHDIMSVRYNVVKYMLINIMEKLLYKIKNNNSYDRIEFYCDVSSGRIVTFSIDCCDSFPPLAIKGTKHNFKINISFSNSFIVSRDVIYVNAICLGYRGAVWAISNKELSDVVINKINNFYSNLKVF